MYAVFVIVIIVMVVMQIILKVNMFCRTIENCMDEIKTLGNEMPTDHSARHPTTIEALDSACV